MVSNAYPNAAPVLAVAKEAAAVQAAIWFFTDGFTITSPSDIKARAEERRPRLSRPQADRCG
ncbi:MAG: Cys-Gln thioester bond-forming surface protein [bacterium]|nr:Cys-Gln thioester bond-forming surface protein [bacterium]